MVLPALDLWDLVIEVLHSSLNTRGNLRHNDQSGNRSNLKNEETFQLGRSQVDQCRSCHFKRKTFSLHRLALFLQTMKQHTHT